MSFFVKSNINSINLSLNELEFFMREAINVASKGTGLVSPNPMVGALLVYQKKIVVKAYHGERGKDHAEIIVLEKMLANKYYLKDPLNFLNQVILFVTLEPCCHYGKTPPCTKLIIPSGIKKVVIAQTDPNPLVAGKGVKALKKAGITVIENILNEVAKEQIRFFRYSITRQKPYFCAKLALDKNNFYAPLELKPALISAPNTILNTKNSRFKFDAIAIGKKTLLSDNPKLELLKFKNKFYRLIICQTADFTVNNLQLFKDNMVIVCCNEIKANYNFTGTTIIYKDLKDLMSKLFALSIQSVLLEGGGEIINLFFKQNLINEFMIVKSKNVVLNSGKSCPVIPNNLKLKQTKSLLDDNLYIYTKENKNFFGLYKTY